MPPVATRPAAVGYLGEAFGFPAAVESGVEVPSGLALGGIGVAAPAGSEVASRPLKAGEADLGGSEFFGPVRRDRGLGRLSLNLEAGEAEGFSDRRRGGLAAFDIEGFGGGGAGVDGPAGPTIHGPLPSQVFDGLVEVVGDEVDGANARLEGQELPKEDEELAGAYLAGEIDAATYQQRIRELVTGRARTA